VSEEKQAAIIRRVYNSTYSHAENILLRLRELEAEQGLDRAIDMLHEEME